jgi:hypothetical protein
MNLVQLTNDQIESQILFKLARFNCQSELNEMMKITHKYRISDFKPEYNENIVKLRLLNRSKLI